MLPREYTPRLDNFQVSFADNHTGPRLREFQNLSNIGFEERCALFWLI